MTVRELSVPSTFKILKVRDSLGFVVIFEYLLEMAVTFKWIIYVVVQRNSLPRHPSTIPRTSKLDSSEHILRAEAVGTPSSSILESSEQSI